MKRTHNVQTDFYEMFLVTIFNRHDIIMLLHKLMGVFALAAEGCDESHWVYGSFQDHSEEARSALKICLLLLHFWRALFHLSVTFTAFRADTLTYYCIFLFPPSQTSSTFELFELQLKEAPAYPQHFLHVIVSELW